MSACLANGIDVYFSRYAAKPNLEEIKDGVWKSIIEKMWSKHISLIPAIISEPKASLKLLEPILEKSINDGEKGYEYFLLYRILRVKEI